MNRILFLILMVFFFNVNQTFAELDYNYKATEYVPIKLTVLNEISTRDEIFEGQEIKLKVRNNVYCHDCLFVKKGTIATARIETIITKGMNGFPAEIILNNFKIDGVESSHLMGEYIKAGRSWALMVYPIKWALTPIPFVGSLTNLIKGGDANIETDDLIIVKYYPHWK